MGASSARGGRGEGAAINKIAPYADDRGNRIEGAAKGKVNIHFRGSGCVLKVGSRVSVEGTLWFDCDGGSLEIGDDAHYKGAIRIGLRSRVRIGRKVTVTDEAFISAVEGRSVTIGDDCMLATRNQLRSDDAHPIYDRRSGKRINLSRDIVLGSHVWLGYEALVFGGASIGDGAVIGARSIVTGSIPARAIAVGAPARVVREDIAWVRKHLSLSAPYDFPDRDPFGPGEP